MNVNLSGLSKLAGNAAALTMKALSAVVQAIALGFQKLTDAFRSAVFSIKKGIVYIGAYTMKAFQNFIKRGNWRNVAQALKLKNVKQAWFKLLDLKRRAMASFKLEQLFKRKDQTAKTLGGALDKVIPDEKTLNSVLSSSTKSKSFFGKIGKGLGKLTKLAGFLGVITIVGSFVDAVIQRQKGLTGCLKIRKTNATQASTCKIVKCSCVSSNITGNIKQCSHSDPDVDCTPVKCSKHKESLCIHCNNDETDKDSDHYFNAETVPEDTDIECKSMTFLDALIETTGQITDDAFKKILGIDIKGIIQYLLWIGGGILILFGVSLVIKR